MDGTVAQINVAADSLIYLQALLNGGLLTGTQRKKRITSTVRPLVDALYQVLAGGTVQVTVKKSGDPGQIKAYQAMEAISLRSINAINQRQPHGIVVFI